MPEAKQDNKNIERGYIIPLRHRWNLVPRYKRTNKAVKAVKEFIVRHMKIRDRDLNKVKLDKYLNETLWNRGIKNPPAKIKVIATREGEIVRVRAVEMPQNIKFKKLREEKITGLAKKIAEQRKEEKKAAEAETPKVEQQESEKKEEEKEKKAATVEAGLEIEKAAAKQMKHEQRQNVKQPKRQVRMALEK